MDNSCPIGGQTYAERYQPLEHNHMSFIDAREVTGVLNHTLGRVLTIIEASIPLHSQCEAMKELVKGALRESHEEAFRAWLCAKQIEFASGNLANDHTRLITSPLANMFNGVQQLG